MTNLYTVTALAWKPDGTRMVLGSLCGGAEVFDCALKRCMYKGKFEFVYVGPSQVVVRQIASGACIVVKSHYNYPIDKLNVFGNDQFLVAHTTETLLLGDLKACQLSEVSRVGQEMSRWRQARSVTQCCASTRLFFHTITVTACVCVCVCVCVSLKAGFILHALPAEPLRCQD